MSETEVEVEDYEEIVGDLYYDDNVEAVPNADTFKEPTLNQNVSSLTPQNRPILRSSNLSLAGDLQESIPKVVIGRLPLPLALIMSCEVSRRTWIINSWIQTLNV